MSRKRSAKGQFVATRKKRRNPDTSPAPIANPRRRRRRRNPDAAAISASPISNPPMLEDLVEFIAPGFAGYAGTRLISRLVNTQLTKKYPNMGKHLAVGSTVVAFLAAWFLLHRIKKVAKYHTPVVVGSGIAVLQSIVQTYLPKYGWMVSDVQKDELKSFPAQSPMMASATMSTAPIETLFPGGPEVVDEPLSTDDLSDLNIDMGSLGAADAAEGEDYLAN